MRNKRNTTVMLGCLCASFWILGPRELAAASPPRLLNDPVDISGDFHNFANLYYLTDTLADFDPATGRGKNCPVYVYKVNTLLYRRRQRKFRKLLFVRNGLQNN